MLYSPTIISIIEVIIVTVPVLLTVAFVTVAERKTMASMQRRLGPNVVGYYGLLQAFADALKLILKEYVSPTQANLVLFFLGPVITLIFSLLGYAVVPYGPGLAIWDFNLGILYMLAVSSLATYGILLAGWSANSKYAFLGSKWPSIGVNLYLLLSRKEKIQRTICEKFTKMKSLNLLGTLYVTPFFLGQKNMLWGFKVKTLFNVNNPQVTKTYKSLVGTSEAIRSLSIFSYNYFGFLCFFSFMEYIRARLYKITKPSHSIKSDHNNILREWLAGLIDASGSFHLKKNGNASLKVFIQAEDQAALQVIKNIYGGSIKGVSGKFLLKYSLKDEKGLVALINDINGKIRNSYRLIQLNKVCLRYNISMIYPCKLKFNDGWLSGFFDAKGSIFMYSYGISITFTDKTRELLQPLTELYGGYICLNKDKNSFIWYITNKEDILKIGEYFKNYPSTSSKEDRILDRIKASQDIKRNICK